MLSEIPTHFETERLVLRCYHPGDGAWYYQVGQRNRQHLQRFESDNMILGIKNEEDGENLINLLAADWAAHKTFCLGGFEKTTGQFAVQIYIGPVDWQLPEFEIGYFADKDYEGQGYVSEAVRGSLAFIFDHLHAHRVCIHCSDLNERSWRVAERCGFVREGHLRETRQQSDGTFSGDFTYGFLKNEFETQRAANGSGG
jgi:RimJ/RimL family protein N-acetyltransferase